MRQTEEQARAEVEALRQQFDAICEEGHKKMNSAKDQVRAIQQEREDALVQLEELKHERRKLLDNQASMEEEHAALVEQKDALLKIVDDLHSACSGAGGPALSELTAQLSPRMRETINSIPNFNLS